MSSEGRSQVLDETASSKMNITHETKNRWLQKRGLPEVESKRKINLHTMLINM